MCAVSLLCLGVFQSPPLPLLLAFPACLILARESGVSPPKGAWLLPGKEESLLSGKAKAALLPAARAQHFGRTDAEQMLS